MAKIRELREPGPIDRRAALQAPPRVVRKPEGRPESSKGKPTVGSRNAKASSTTGARTGGGRKQAKPKTSAKAKRPATEAGLRRKVKTGARATGKRNQ